MFIEFKKEVSDVLLKAARKCRYDADSAALVESEHADIASQVAFRLAPKYRKSPKDIAKEISDAINVQPGSLIGKIEVAGPYINFTAGKSLLNGTVRKILEEQSGYGTLDRKEQVILEHTSANPDGPLHVGHIRNSVIGDTLARILRRAGCEVETQYYINDMGRQVAVVVWGLANFEFDNAKKADHAIADVYIGANRLLEKVPGRAGEVDALMQQNERGDAKIIARFTHGIDVAMAGIRETLLRMNIRHDRFVSESTFVRAGDVERIIRRIKETGRTEYDNGALVIGLGDFGIEKKLVLQRSDGTSLYTTRDLAYHEWKAGLCDRMIDILGADHKLISSQLRAVLQILGIKQPEIVIFEFVSLPEGSMSTRRGVFISADELLDQIEARALEEVSKRRPETDENFRKDVARAIGIGAVRYDIIRVSPDKSTVFNWEEALDFEKQGAPFIQYAHARACSILEKAKAEGISRNGFDPALLVEEQEVALIRHMAKFGSVIDTAASERKPHLLALYARELADRFNQFYRYVSVLGAEEDVRASRLALVDCARIVLANALDTLGIAAPVSM